MKALLIHNRGTFASIQDLGRPGWRRFGIPVSGAMDQFSLSMANLLVGNPAGAAALEIGLPGLALEAAAPLTIALTGADLGACWNGQPAPTWQVLRLERGDRLSFESRVHGAWAYLALQGGCAGEAFLGSRSTFAKGGMGRRLAKGDVIEAGLAAQAPPSPGRSLAPRFRPAFSGEQVVRAIVGPQADAFAEGDQRLFFSSSYRVSPQSDRQGLRLEGPELISSGGDLISEPTPLGSIQVPGDGRPIVLQRDGQVTGGYPKIAVVATADLDRLSRAGPGDVLRFEAVTAAAAVALRAERRRRLAGLAAGLPSPAFPGKSLAP